MPGCAGGIIGAGSGFGSRLSIDILSRESLRDSTIALCDIDTGRLEQVRACVQRANRRPRPARQGGGVHRARGVAAGCRLRRHRRVDRRSRLLGLWQAIESHESFAQDQVRVEMMRHFGYFVTESTRHNAEYLPYFGRTQELCEQYGVPPRDPVSMANVRQRHRGAITNLPAECCVEVPCVADAEGVRPTFVGALPTQCAALNRTNVNVQELAVEAVLRRDRDAAYHACVLDPLTAAVAPLPKLREMFDELWAAEGDRLAYLAA